MRARGVCVCVCVCVCVIGDDDGDDMTTMMVTVTAMTVPSLYCSHRKAPCRAPLSQRNDTARAARKRPSAWQRPLAG